MTLPPKPAAVAHVSDAHWEAALDAVWLIEWKGGKQHFKDACHKHFADLTFPAVAS